MTQASTRLVETLADRFRDLETEFHKAYWDSQTEATPAAEQRRAELELELRRIKGDAAALEAVTEALGNDVHDPVLRRQLEVLRLSLTANQMDDGQRARIVEVSSAVESDFASYRPEIDGRRLSDNEIEEILITSSDEEERRKAWEGAKEIGAVVADRIRELVRLRNEAAHDLGYADYYRMSLDLEEIPEEWLFALMDELEELTGEVFTRWKDCLDARLRERFGTETLRPWHYADPFFQSLPPDGRVGLDDLLREASAADLAQRTFEGWGIDLSKVLGASDLHPREKKCQHAFCLDVDRSGDDVRILANVVPGERWIEVMLHESGHAAYDISIDARLPYLLHRPAHTFVTEAIAILSGRLVRRPRWLVDVAEVPAEEVGPIEEELARATAAQSLLFARWGLVMVHFERDLYSDPEADLDARWWELVERFQQVSPPPDRTAPDWAAKIHLAGAPVYYHNYLLGEMLASQLEATCEREAGGVAGSAAAGDLLAQRVFHSGALLRWDGLIEEATGKELAAADFAAALAV